MDHLVNEQYPPHDYSLIPPYDPPNPPQQQIEHVDYHDHMDQHFAELPLDPHQQIELVQFQLPLEHEQQYIEQRTELRPEEEEWQLQQQQNEFQNQNMDNAVDYADEDVDNSALFQYGGSLEFSRVPEDLQRKLRNEYFKVLRARDVLDKLLERTQIDNLQKDKIILQLNQLMEQKDEQLLSLMPKLPCNGEGSPPEGAPSPKHENPQSPPEPVIVAAVNFSLERSCLHQQIKLSNEKIGKMKREAIDSIAKQEKRCAHLKLKLHESNQQWAQVEVEKSSLAKQIQDKDEQLIAFKAQMDRFEKFKNRELDQMANEQAKVMTQLKARLTEFEKTDSERINIARNALNLQNRAELELKRFKKSYYKDVRSLLEQKKNLTAELNESKLYLGSDAKQQNLKRKFNDLHPQLFSVSSNVSNLEALQNDFFRVLIVEKDKNIQLQKRVKELEKWKKDAIYGEMEQLKNTFDQDSVQPEEEEEEEEIPPLIQVNTEFEEDSQSQSSNGLHESDLNDLKIGDRYISLITTTERFWEQNKSLCTKLETLEAELNEAQQRNCKLVAQLEQAKLAEARRNSEQLKQNLDIQARFANAELAIEENRQLRARLEERNAKLKQLDENLLDQARENTKWLAEMKLAQSQTQMAEDRVNGLSVTILRLEAEMAKLRQENDERLKRLHDEHDERLKQLDDEQGEEINDLIQQLNRTEDELTNKRYKLRRWKVGIVGLKRRIAELTNQEYDSTVEDDEFEDEPDSEDDFGSEVGESGGEVDELDDQVDESGGQVDESNGQVDELDDQVDESGGQVDESNGRVDESNGQVGELDDQVDELDDQVDESDGQVDESNGQVDESNGQVGELDDQVDESGGQVDELDDQVDESGGQVDESNGRVDESNGQVGELDDQVDESNGQVDESGGQVDELDDQVDESNGQVDESDGEDAQLDSEDGEVYSDIEFYSDDEDYMNHDHGYDNYDEEQ